MSARGLSRSPERCCSSRCCRAASRCPRAGRSATWATRGSPTSTPPAATCRRGPEAGASQVAVVNGFLDAMTATPIQTTSAKLYLTEQAQVSWQPEAQTLVYEEAAQPVQPTRRDVQVDLVDAYRLDDRGVFAGMLPEGDEPLDFRLDLEAGEWRISRGPGRARREPPVGPGQLPHRRRLLPRPDRRDPGARAGLGPARRAVRQLPDAQPRGRSRTGAAPGLAQLLPARPGADGGRRRRGRRRRDDGRRPAADPRARPSWPPSRSPGRCGRRSRSAASG